MADGVNVGGGFAYRCAEELAARLHEQAAARLAWRNGEQVRAMIAECGEHLPVTSNGIPNAPGDWTTLGFTQGTGERAKGLRNSENRNATYLVPRKDGSGDVWRARMELLDGGPRIGEVFAEFGIPTLTSSGVRFGRPAMHLEEESGAALLRYSTAAPDPLSEHLAPIPMSEWFAALERDQARVAARQAVDA